MRFTLPEGPFEPTWESLRRYTVPQWYQDGKFGIFIHWGVYSVPAFGNEWYPRQMYLQGSREYEHHLATYGPHTEFGYKDFIPQLTAERYDPAAWANLFRRAGAKFVVPVAEHHDGFAMYESQLTEWCAAKMGPKRDLIGELAKAVREEWMVFGLSSHRAEHWWFFDGGMAYPSDVQDPRYTGLYGPAQPEKMEPNEEFLDDWLARLIELVDRYEPQIVWFDWWIEQPAFAEHLKRFAAYYYNRGAQWNRGVAINYKNEAMPVEAAVYDVERGQLGDTRPCFWQTDTAVSRNSWGYIEGQDYKSPGSIVQDLVDIVSKNGALLLNIGPRPDGTIPEGDEAILLEVGRWLWLNGEAIYGSRPWKVYGEGPTRVVEGGFTDTQRAAFTGEDVRFTTKGRTLYATLLAWPQGGEAVLRSLGSNLRLFPDEIGEVRLIGFGQPLEWRRDPDALRAKLPAEKPCDHAFVLRITPR